jgi:hypothetical protein
MEQNKRTEDATVEHLTSRNHEPKDDKKLKPNNNNENPLVERPFFHKSSVRGNLIYNRKQGNFFFGVETAMYNS